MSVVEGLFLLAAATILGVSLSATFVEQVRGSVRNRQSQSLLHAVTTSESEGSAGDSVTCVVDPTSALNGAHLASVAKACEVLNLGDSFSLVVISRRGAEDLNWANALISAAGAVTSWSPEWRVASIATKGRTPTLEPQTIFRRNGVVLDRVDSDFSAEAIANRWRSLTTRPQHRVIQNGEVRA